MLTINNLSEKMKKKKNSIFSKNEIKFLKGLGEVEYEKNYIYQLRHTIKQKVKNFIFNDLKLLLERKKENNVELKANILKEEWLDYLIYRVLEQYPNLILKILKLNEVKEYLGTHYLEKRIRDL